MGGRYSDDMMKAGSAQRDVTPAVGLEITHPVRTSVGVLDPLFTRAIVLEDATGVRVAIVCSDLIGAGFDVCDAMRSRITEATGITHVLLNFSHPHSSRGLGAYADTPADADWMQSTQDAMVAAVAEAAGALKPVTLKAGRSPVQVGFNRRVVSDEGYVFMAPNEEGSVVPWVNVLIAESADGSPMTVLFQHTAHPVIVPDDIAMISADFPGIAATRIADALGGDAIAMFAQGCAGNINGFPLRSSYDNAVAAGEKLADAVLGAIETCVPIDADTFDIRFAETTLPPVTIPSVDVWRTPMEALKIEHAAGKYPHWSDAEFAGFLAHFDKLEAMQQRGETPPDWQMNATCLSLGDEWAVIAYPHEMFCDYELWVDQHAPFAHTMVFNYTNGAIGYIPTDNELARGDKSGYEASCLPSWGSANVMTRHFGPPAVGAEQIIHNLTASLWS
jgi:neutral ceramidase